MAAVECRDGQDVHEGEDDGQEGRHAPEHHPVPSGREKASDGTETSERLGSVGCGHILQVAHVAAQYVDAVLDAGRETLEETVGYLLGLVVGGEAGLGDTDFQVFGEHHPDGVAVGDDGCRAQFQTVASCLGCRHHVAQYSYLIGELVPAVYGFPIDGQNLVALSDAGFLSRRCGHHAVDVGRDERTAEGRLGLEHVQQTHVLGYVDADSLPVALHLNGLGIGNVAIYVYVEALECLAVVAGEDVVVAETDGLGIVVELEAHGHVLCGEIAVAPGEHHHTIDEEGEQEIHQYAANHDEQALPGGLGAEFPGLLGLSHLFFVETLVDHARNLAVAAQGQPSCTILGVAVFGFELKE